MAPYPFGVVSLILSTTSLPLVIYIQACSIALLKIVTHILVGSSIQSFAHGSVTPLEIGVLVVSIILGIYHLKEILLKNRACNYVLRCSGV